VTSARAVYRRNGILRNRVLTDDENACMFPTLMGLTGYSYGCRCERCVGTRRAYDAEYAEYRNRRKRERRRRA